MLSYNFYWIAVILGFLALRYKEVKGHWPLMKAKERKTTDDEAVSTDEKIETSGLQTPENEDKVARNSTNIQEVHSSSS